MSVKPVPVIDQQILLEAKALMKDKFKLMVEYFIEDCEGYVADVNTGFVDCDYNKIAAAAHTIKSSSRQLGALQLSELGKNIESMARTEWREGLEEVLPDLKKVFAETKEALAAI